MGDARWAMDDGRWTMDDGRNPRSAGMRSVATEGWPSFVARCAKKNDNTQTATSPGPRVQTGETGLSGTACDWTDASWLGLDCLVNSRSGCACWRPEHLSRRETIRRVPRRIRES